VLARKLGEMAAEADETIAADGEFLEKPAGEAAEEKPAEEAAEEKPAEENPAEEAAEEKPVEEAVEESEEKPE
jgi:hypothetical protein